MPQCRPVSYTHLDVYKRQNKSYGSLFFTRRGSGIKNLEDMRGRTLVANHPNGPYSYLVGMGEIERAGYDESTFFKSQRFLMQSAEDVVQAVLDGRADVGIVASCILEDFFPAVSEARRNLEPVALKAAAPCMRSTDQHPNWTLSAVRGADPETTREEMCIRDRNTTRRSTSTFAPTTRSSSCADGAPGARSSRCSE